MELAKYARLFSSYTELRAQTTHSLSIGFLNGSNIQNGKSTTSGVSARVYHNGAWGFASSPDFTDESFASVIKAATDNAAFLDQKQPRNKPQLVSNCSQGIHDYSTSKPRLTQKQLTGFTKEIDQYIAKKYPKLTSRYVSLGELNTEKSLITSDGGNSFSFHPRSLIAVSMTVERDDRPIELYDVFGDLGQVEDVFDKPDSLYPKIDELYDQLLQKQAGIYPESGVKECILDADLGGILAHEAIGHTTEADMVLGGSIAGKFMNKEVASPLISIVDFANTALGKTCPIPLFIDDEGTQAEDVVIIDQGILKSYLHNKESAQEFQVNPTGNARAWAFSDEPLIRMRNTAILPGKDKLEDMIASIDDGYYLMKTNNGQADTTSEFMFGVVLGYEIKNGKLGRALFDTTISGIAFDVLKTVTMVSDDMSWSAAGTCGKKQPMPVGMGGPAIKCRVNIGGR